MGRSLSVQDLSAYERDGYLAYDRLLSEREVDALVTRIEHYVAHPKEGIRIQVEPVVQQGRAQAVRPIDGIRKIEKLVENDDLYLGLAKHPGILPRIQDILGEPVRIFRDALMMKPAGLGSAKPYHQDSAYWSIDPMTLCSIWVAMEDATVENGCMRVIAGSQHDGVIEHKHLEDFMVTDDHIDYSKEVTVPLHKGGVLFFHSLLLHATSPNTSDKSRRAMVVSYMGAHHKWTGKPDEEPKWLVVS
ncbi:MAG: phytanoyl-CoA dioxygenase family protein [Candidatus Hydrogenedentes bacterium]|nr:phytanoyl-CoA dioxygenase family protein [Candidatus Hydrogenedentota bacterium]